MRLSQEYGNKIHSLVHPTLIALFLWAALPASTQHDLCGPYWPQLSILHLKYWDYRKTTNQQIANTLFEPNFLEIISNWWGCQFLKSSKSVWESVAKIPGAFDHGLLFLNSYTELVLRQHLFRWLRLALNSLPSCLWLQRAGITALPPCPVNSNILYPDSCFIQEATRYRKVRDSII